MESVVFDGKEFVKASVLAEKFRYTQDYLGQLCRGKKVDARLVGRAWYINLDSLNSHRSARYKTTPKAEVLEDKKPSNHYLSRVDVEPILKQKTVKIVKGGSGKLTELSMKYEGDDYALIPRVNKSAISTNIHILPAEAEKLKVHNNTHAPFTTNFKTESLPEVFLSGMLKVEGLSEIPDEPVEKTAADEEIKLIKQEKPLHATTSVTIRTLKRPTAPVVMPALKKIAVEPVRAVIMAPEPIVRPVPLSTLKPPVPSFAPASLATTKKTTPQNTHSLLLPAASLVVGAICGFFILSTESLLQTSSGSHTDNFVIQASNVQQVAKVIFSKMK